MPPSVNITRNHSLEEPSPDPHSGTEEDDNIEMPMIKLKNSKFSTLSPVLESTPNFNVMGLPPFRSRHLLSNISQSHQFKPKQLQQESSILIA